MDISEKCASIKSKLTPDEGRWAEAAEDITDIMGEKAASVIAAVEQYFKNVHHSYESYEDFSKRAFVRNLACDRHGIIKLAGEIAEFQEMLEKVAMPQVAQLISPAQVVALNQLAAQLPPTPGGSASPAGTSALSAPTPSGSSTAVDDADDEDDDTLPRGKNEEVELPIKPAEDISALLEAMGPCAKGLLSLQQEDMLNTKPVK